MPGAEIPVWVGGLQKWVTGLTKKTTCEDIVRALLRSEGRPQVELDKEWAHYVLVERWRKVERPLDAKTKVLKVWKAWAEEQPNVRLTLRRAQPSLTPKEVKALRIKRSAMQGAVHGVKLRHGSSTTMSMTTATSMATASTTVHPRKLLQQQQRYKQCSDMDGRITDTMERLMKVIIAQGQTIQAQLHRLQDKDSQIDFFEQQVHVMRVEEMGANYLVDSYLGTPPPSKGTSASAAADETTFAAAPAVEAPVPRDNEARQERQEVEQEADSTQQPSSQEAQVALQAGQDLLEADKDIEQSADAKVRDLRRCARHYERLLVLSDRLEREEQMVVWLTAQMDQLRQKLPAAATSSSATSNVDESYREEMLVELELLRERVEYLAAQNVANDVEVDENESAIVDVCRSIADKHCYVAHLERDLCELELDYSSRLMHHRDQFCSSSSTSTSMMMMTSTTMASVVNVLDGSTSSSKDKDRQNDTDSNSDTGLSSLHSSCDEGGPGGAYVLDTLV